jgi:hypothetical protein
MWKFQDKFNYGKVSSENFIKIGNKEKSDIFLHF